MVKLLTIGEELEANNFKREEKVDNWAILSIFMIMSGNNSFTTLVTTLYHIFLTC